MEGRDSNALEPNFAKGRGKETLFRVAARNQIELIAIADNKANIVIGINVLLITVILAVFGSDFHVKGEPIISRVELVVPFGILLITCLISAVLATIAAKPKIIKGKKEGDSSKLFFQNFYRESLEEYMADIYQVLSSRETIYRQMITDMYNNGLVLQQKYSLLSRSYNIFITGLVLGVLSFVLVMVMV